MKELRDAIGDILRKRNIPFATVIADEIVSIIPLENQDRHVHYYGGNCKCIFCRPRRGE